MNIWLSHYFFNIVKAYRNNYLFAQETFGYHVKLRFSFVVNNLVNFQNLVRRKFGEGILDFDNFTDVFFQDLSIWFRFWHLISFVKFIFYQNRFFGFRRNRWRNPGDVSRFTFIFVFFSLIWVNSRFSVKL